jgi:hypothetical protein
MNTSTLIKMLLSHKHKLIFIKTHKTSTQTCNKFLKDHLGPDDVIAGDSEQGTEINCDLKQPATGKSAADYRNIYGNHLPWFIIKEIVGDEVWETYTKFTIERSPYDRFVSLFCFLNPELFMPAFANGVFFRYIKDTLSDTDVPQSFINQHLDNVRKETQTNYNNETIASMFKEETREYFEDWVLTQLRANELNITAHQTYGNKSHDHVKRNCIQSSKQLKSRCLDFDKHVVKYREKHREEQPLGSFPYIVGSKFKHVYGKDIITRMDRFINMESMFAQCRFLNYGYYYDGKEIKVDKIIDYNNVANNIGQFFKEMNINITCNKQVYDKRSENIHYRKQKNIQPVNWWFGGKQQQTLKSEIEKRFNFLKQHIKF